MAELHPDWTPGTEPRKIPLSRLLLDPKNPRLPEHLVDGSQASQLRYLFENGTLDELARSFADNGYFDQEPLLVLREGDEFVVVEGNRRLSTLKILLQDSVAVEVGLAFDIDVPEGALRDELSDVPCFLLESRDQVFTYLGFRHIGGVKTWPPEAKARYLAGELERAVGEGTSPADVFRVVGRRVGSNAAGVRNPYLALRLLRHARDEDIVNDARVQQLQSDRFGVWLRAMNAAALKDYIELGAPSTYDEVESAIASVSSEKLAEVVTDMTSESSAVRQLLADSRQVTVYSRAINNATARRVLRETQSIDAAEQIVDRLTLKDRIFKVSDRVSALVSEVEVGDVPADALEPAEGLARRSRQLLALIQSEVEPVRDEPAPE